ncbi:MAG: hypothetical protein ACOCUW_00410 [Gemmatimonadota bacterium]
MPSAASDPIPRSLPIRRRRPLERAGHLVGTTIAPHVRLFGLRDDAERKDVLVPVHYPHSLLYFISGVCEDEVDAPLIGMQRFFADRYRRLPGVRRVVERLDAPWEAWAATESEAGDGWRTRASSHLAFGEEVTTLESVRHLVATGY